MPFFLSLKASVSLPCFQHQGSKQSFVALCPLFVKKDLTFDSESLSFYCLGVSALKRVLKLMIRRGKCNLTSRLLNILLSCTKEQSKQAHSFKCQPSTSITNKGSHFLKYLNQPLLGPALGAVELALLDLLK